MSGKNRLPVILKFFFGINENQKPALRNIQKILVVRQDNRIGNLVFITPLLILLKNKFPKCFLTLAVGGTYPDILTSADFIDEVICYDQKAFLLNPFKFLTFIKTVRNKKFDLVFDGKRILSFNNYFLTVMSGAGIRVGFRHPAVSGLYHYEVSELSDTVIYEPDNLARLFGVINPDYQTPAIKIIVPSPLKKTCLETIHKNFKNLDKQPDVQLVAIHPGGRGGKRFDVKKILAVASTLVIREQVRLLIILGPEELELKPVFEKIRHALILLPDSVIQLAGFISHLRLLICNDTGSLHLAAALNVPTVSIFLNTSPLRYAPRGSKHIAIHHMNATEIPTSEILEKVNESLGTKVK